MRARAHRWIIASGIALALTLTAAPATAGVDWFGLSFGVGGFSFSLGYSDYPVYGNSWHDPSWSLDFDLALTGYGGWVWVEGLGRVWQPYVAADWQPYSNGQWVWTANGWTWVAYEPWGYVPHHYGSWAMTTFGWVWVPGYTYRPANVVWSHCGGYVGWYAAAPRGWSHWHRGFWHGYDRGYHRGYDRGYGRGYGDGYEDGWRDARYATWVDWKHMGAGNVADHRLSHSAVQRGGGGAQITRMDAGPSRGDFERHTGHAVREVRVSERQVEMDGRAVTVVRPEGVERDIQSHARETVTRSLDTTVARKLERGERVVATSVDRSGHQVVEPTVTRSQPSSSRIVDVSRQPISVDRSSDRRTVERSAEPSSREVISPSRSRSSETPSGREATVSRRVEPQQRSRTPTSAPSSSERSPVTVRESTRTANPRVSTERTGPSVGPRVSPERPSYQGRQPDRSSPAASSRTVRPSTPTSAPRTGSTRTVTRPEAPSSSPRATVRQPQTSHSPQVSAPSPNSRTPSRTVQAPRSSSAPAQRGSSAGSSVEPERSPTSRKKVVTPSTRETTKPARR